MARNSRRRYPRPPSRYNCPSCMDAFRLALGRCSRSGKWHCLYCHAKNCRGVPWYRAVPVKSKLIPAVIHVQPAAMIVEIYERTDLCRPFSVPAAEKPSPSSDAAPTSPGA